MESQWCIIATAHRVSVVYGPFASYDEAVDWSDTLQDGLAWEITTLHAPSKRPQTEDFK